MNQTTDTISDTTTEARQPSPVALGDAVSIGDEPSRWPAAGCVAWIESSDRRCGREHIEGQYVCKRHHGVAVRRVQARQERDAQRTTRWAVEAEARRPALVEKLRAVQARIDRLDPPAPTTDPAAYMGIGSTTARRYRARYTPDRIHELAELHTTRDRPRSQIGATWLAENGM